MSWGSSLNYIFTALKQVSTYFCSQSWVLILKKWSRLFNVFFKILREYLNSRRFGSSLGQGLSLDCVFPAALCTMRLASLGVGAIERIKVCDNKELLPVKWLCLAIFSFLANIIAPKQLIYYLYNNFLMGHCWIELGSFHTQSECPHHCNCKIISFIRCQDRVLLYTN